MLYRKLAGIRLKRLLKRWRRRKRMMREELDDDEDLEGLEDDDDDIPQEVESDGCHVAEGFEMEEGDDDDDDEVMGLDDLEDNEEDLESLNEFERDGLEEDEEAALKNSAPTNSKPTSQIGKFVLPSGQQIDQDPNLSEDLQLVHTRIQEIVRVLNNFKEYAEEGRARSDYTEQLLKDLALYYGYNEYLMEKLFHLFTVSEAIEFFEANEVQPASSYLPVMALAPQEGERVLDMCSAPGGKSTYISALMRNTGSVFANDASRERCRSLVANVHRLAFPSAIGGFDRVLLDAPCSGTGVISKDPSVKINKGQGDFDMLAEVQRELVLAAIDSVDAGSKTGGFIVYSTCSVTVEENEDVVAYAWRKRPNERQSQRDFWIMERSGNITRPVIFDRWKVALVGVSGWGFRRSSQPDSWIVG
ncbi:NOL1/NOP2/sun family-domain-containing protein [Chytridium lagenaria]|nr:NOL1/NOP2/sun family-domain-containing protein [Chytridium lagenaria]